MACVLSPSLGWALGLGEIHLNSALNEPMRAEIDLIAATPEELTALRASLAGRDAFTRYGIDRPPFLSSLVFKVGKSKDKRDVLLVTSTEAIPEPFVTFLVEVNWSRGRLMREYTLLLDPPVYSPGETATSSAPVAAATTAPAMTAAPTPAPTKSRSKAPAEKASAAPSTPPEPNSAETLPAPAPESTEARPLPERIAASGNYRVNAGDTLSKIARSLNAKSRSEIDMTMIALFRDNPRAFDGNINVLRRGAILRVPGADEIAALNQQEAISEVNKQMSAWRSRVGALADGSHLRLVTPKSTAGTLGTGNSTASEAPAVKPAASPTPAPSSASSLEAQALKDRESQAAQQRLIAIHNAELAALQHKAAETPPPAVAQPVAPPPVAATPPTAVAPTTATPPSAEATTPPTAAIPTPKKPTVAKPPVPVSSGSWLDWISDNWMIPVAVLVVLVAGVIFTRFRKRQKSQIGDFGAMAATDVAGNDTTAKILGIRKGDDSFLVEESGEHPAPDFAHEPSPEPVKASDDTLSSESAVNLDQGDPLAEADFHMAYGLYDQAADLVRIALDREPDRRDLRLKLLEIYFVWGNKDAFLQTAKVLEASRDRAPAGEWDKIVIMGKQICPDEPLFSKVTGSGRGAGTLVDLNLEGGENRIDIDLFGDPEGERSSLDHSIAKETGDTEATGESPHLQSGAGLDFMLDAPERGADVTTTREMPPRDEPTVESEVMEFPDSPTRESPAVKSASIRDRISNKLGGVGTDQTAEVSIDDLGLDLEGLDEAGADSAKVRQLEATDHPDDAPTMVAGLDERSRRMMAEAENRSRDRDLTELERELEASFISELESSHEEIKTAVIGPESAPTVQMPRDLDAAATSRFKTPEYTDKFDAAHSDLDSTSKLRGINADSVDLDLDRLATALGGGDTLEQPRAAEDVFSTEVFEGSQRSRRVDLDVGEALNGSDALTPGVRTQNGSGKLQSTTTTAAPAAPEFEPVTMSEVGTKLDLARAYMDMGDPEGARNILDEVVQEGSASQKQEAQRLIQSLPG
ncbi:MAG: FimV/HubP family polar landmark protein [Steroidobacteraceae bacterium]|jgi:pilus assembly protein FimV